MNAKLEEMIRLAKLKQNLDAQMKDWLRQTNAILKRDYVTTTGAAAELDNQIRIGLDYE